MNTYLRDKNPAFVVNGLHDQNEFYHYGIKGMKWGVRRFQNNDGSLTAKGLKRYRWDTETRTESTKSIKKKISDAHNRKVESESEWFQKFSDAVDSELRSKTTHDEWNKNQTDSRYKINSIDEYAQPKGWYRQPGTGLSDYYKNYGLKSWDQARQIASDDTHPAVKQFKKDYEMSSKYDDWIEDRVYEKHPEVNEAFSNMKNADREYNEVCGKYKGYFEHSNSYTDELCHYGIKGMKWGVRRYQNKDGTLTKEGKERNTYRNNIIRNRPYTDDVNDIVRTLSNKEKKLLGASLHEDWIEKDYENETLANKGKTIVEKYNDVPVSFVEIWTNGGRTGQVAIATRKGDQYRGKGYAQKSLEKAIKWVDRYGRYTIDELEWWAKKNNTGSRRLAEKNGFVETDNQGYDDYVRYIRKVNN